MPRFILCTIIGLLCAVIFTIIRGGWHDAPFVVPVFAISGFAIAYMTAALINLDRLATNRLAVLKKREARMLRDVVAAIIVASAVYWSGPLIQSGSYGAWLVAIFLGVALPLVVCLIASRAVILYGVSAASAIMISTMLYQPKSHTADWFQYLWRDLFVWMFIWFILLALSLIVSIPLAVQRSRTPKC